MKNLTIVVQTVLIFTALALGSQWSVAQEINFRFLGNSASGLSPANQLPPVNSDALGDEIGDGVVYDPDSMVLSLSFTFEGLTGGLLDLSGGIHLHDAGPTDPFNNAGPIEFFLNLDGANVPIGSSSGTIDVDVILSEEQEAELFNRQYFINIHSVSFGIGELLSLIHI